MMLCLLSQYVIVGQDSCAVFGNDRLPAEDDGVCPQTRQWEDINYVIHIHIPTASQIALFLIRYIAMLMNT